MSPIFTAIDKQANIFAMKWSSYTRNKFTVTIFDNDIGVFGNIDLFALNNIGKKKVYIGNLRVELYVTFHKYWSRTIWLGKIRK